MAGDTTPTRYAGMSFNSPLSEERADAMVARLAAAGPRTVLDLGCGWGELLLRVVAAAPGSTGTGVDLDDGLLERGRSAASGRGLADRVTLVGQPAADVTLTADAVICVGSTHALGDTAEALAFLRERVSRGGRVLLGEGTWDGRLAGDVAEVPNDITNQPTLADLVEMSLEAGFRPLHIEEASTGEWDDFESRYLAGSEEWLLSHPDDPSADAVRGRADEHRRMWLRGYRRALGLAYLTLGVPT
jgi:SAM-dependent methyltransferase